MNKKKFLEKWKISGGSTAYYKTRFPEVLNEKGTIDYGKLDEKIQERVNNKEKVKKIMANKKAKEIEFLFTGKHTAPKSHIFLNQLNASNEQILVRDSNYKKYLQIIEHFRDPDIQKENII